MIRIDADYMMNHSLVIEFLERWPVVKNLAIRLIDPRLASEFNELGRKGTDNASDYYRLIECFYSQSLDRLSYYYNPPALLAPLIIMRESEEGVKSCFGVREGKVFCLPNGFPQHEQDFREEWEFDPANESAVMEGLTKMGFNAHDIAAAAAGTDERRTYEEEQKYKKALKGSVQNAD